MYLSKQSVQTHLYFFIVAIFVSYWVANREINNVADTMNYAQNFMHKTDLTLNYEFLFDFITYIIRIFTDNYVIYFFILNFILNLILFRVVYSIANYFNFNKLNFFLCILCLLLVSSWYHSSAFNGLRQGLALALCYYSFICFLDQRNKIKSLLFFISSCFFHYSNFLIIPFIFLFRLSINKFYIFLNILGLFYFLNVNEIIVEKLSSIFSLPIYYEIKNYTEDGDISYRYGFQLDLFIYTMFFVHVYWLFNRLYIKNNENFSNIVKLFYILVCPYFVFGFAGYSNRYGVIAWFFSVFINGCILYFLVINNDRKFLGNFLIILFIFCTLLFYFRFF